MQFNLDLSTGTVTAEFGSLDEFQQLVAAMSTEPPAPTYPPMFVLDVASHSEADKYYKTFIWFDGEGKHFFCPCPDHTYRQRVCKHLSYAELIRTRRADQLVRIPA
jgi:hypothetical protein